MSELILDMSNQREKLQLIQRIRELSGPHRVKIVKFRKRRSDNQNRYYWGCLVSSFADWARAEGNELTDEECHEYLKMKFLTKTIVKMETGEVIGDTVRSTASLTTEEFNHYIEQCSQYIAEFCGIAIPNV